VEKRTPTPFLSSCACAACLSVPYGYFILFSAGFRPSIFLSAGAFVVVGRLKGIWSRARRPDGGARGFRSGIPALAGDLAFLAALQQGFIQANVEMGRGNMLGMCLCLAFVTPILALLARTLVLEVGNRLGAK